MDYRQTCGLPCAPQYQDSDELIRRRASRDHGRSTRHRDGLCGGPAASCADCVADEVRELASHVGRYVDRFPRALGERYTDWYMRLGGRMYDGWPTVVDALAKNDGGRWTD